MNMKPVKFHSKEQQQLTCTCKQHIQLLNIKQFLSRAVLTEWFIARVLRYLRE